MRKPNRRGGSLCGKTKRKMANRNQSSIAIEPVRFVFVYVLTLLTVASSLSLSLSLSLREHNDNNRTGVGPFLGEEYNVRSRVAENEKRESVSPWMWPRLRVGNVQFDVF